MTSYTVHLGYATSLMSKTATKELNGNRFETRIGYVTGDIEWLYSKEEWKGLACIGAINRQITIGDKTTNTWHYYISSKQLTADELLYYARNEWSVEVMHWRLDVYFKEDETRVKDTNILPNMNMLQKIALNRTKTFKEKTKDKRALNKIMASCLRKPERILNLI